MQTISEILSAEHRHIIKMLDLMEKEARELSSGGAFKKSFWTKAADFLRHYADKFHHAKEEDLLFAELNRNMHKMHCCPMEQMVFEHNEGREHVGAMLRALESDDGAGVAEHAKGFSALLRDHIFKEDNILYPMAEDILDEAAKEEMLKKFSQFDRAVEDKYLSVIAELSNTL